MSRPNTDGGWLLPDEIDPPARIGVCVPVPDAPEHRQAFLGALLQLARWWNWQRDPLKRGREAAAVWMNIWRDVLDQLQEGEGCGAMPFDVRQNEDAPCILEKTDDGDTWVQFADLTLCRPRIPAVMSGGDVFVQYEGELIPFEQLPPDVDTVTTSDERRPIGSDADEARCLAALNAAYVFRLLHQESWKFTPFTQKPGTVLIGSAIALVGLGLIAAPAIPFAAAAALIAFWFQGFATQFTSTVEREFACILKNRSYISNGEVFFDFALVKSDVASRIVGINVWSFINGYLDVIQANGLNLAGTTTAITQCCDPCNNSVFNYDIDLKVLANRDYFVPVQTFTNSTFTWIAGTGWRLTSAGNTAQGRARATIPINPNCEIVNFFFRFTTSHEPYNWSLTVGSNQRVENGYRPFGNFFHGFASAINIGVRTLNAVLFLNVNPVINTSATFDILRIQYRGCPPL